jgi:hypothetical protein
MNPKPTYIDRNSRDCKSTQQDKKEKLGGHDEGFGRVDGNKRHG